MPFLIIADQCENHLELSLEETFVFDAWMQTAKDQSL